MVIGVGHHHRLREVGFHVENGAEAAEGSGDGFIGWGWVVCKSDPSWLLLVVVLGGSRGGDMPMEVSTPFTENRSLIDTGSPCRGPIVLPVLSKYSSNFAAVAKASSKRISVQHVVSWWARAARFANARVSSNEESPPDDSFRSRMVMSVSSVRASSAGVRHLRI